MIKKIGFISYKGGVGRSLCLANVAVALAKMGHRVGIMDFDFDAPGQHHIFDVRIDPDRNSLLKVISEMNLVLLADSIIDITTKIKPRAKGKLFLCASYINPQIYDNIDWASISTRTFIKNLIESFAKGKELNFVLLDAKAGLSTELGLALELVDNICIIFRLNRQNLFGVKRLSEISRTGGYPKAFYIASSVPNSQSNETRSALKKFRREIKDEEIIIVPYDINLGLFEQIVTSDKFECFNAFATIAEKFHK